MATRTRTQERRRWHRLVGGGGTASFTEYPTGSYTWNGQKYYPPYISLCNSPSFGAMYAPTLYSNTDLHRYDYSTMVDEEPSDRTRKSWNYCSHVKRDLVSGRHWFSAKKSATSWAVEANRFSIPAAVYESDLPSAPTETMLHNWRAESYSLLVPKFGSEADFSLFNFLLELGELKGAVKLCTRGISAVATHWSNMLQRTFSDPSQLSKTPAELTLMYDFGIKPLVNDSATLSAKLVDVRNKIAAFNRRGQLKATHHVELPYTTSQSSVVSGMTRVFTVKRHLFRAQAELTYELRSETIDRLSDLDLLAEYLGLRATPSRIWNAIPFSFLVDWFVNVGECLESLDSNDAFRAVPRVTRYSETLISEVWKIACIKVGGTVVNNYTHQYVKSEVHEDKLLPESLYTYLDGWIPIDYTVVRRYLRQPRSWAGTFTGPFAHVRLPELSAKLNVQRLRDGLALARVRLGR